MIDFSDGGAAAGVLNEAAGLISDDPNRKHGLLSFGNSGQLVMTGDMHGNLRNFDKLQKFCDLRRNPGRQVMLHELIHREPSPGDEVDFSIDLLVRAATWKCDFPDSVFFMQSNHELSQLQGHEITKGGRCVTADFERGVARRYGRNADRVMEGVNAYLKSLPLAGKTANGIFLAHSLPDPLTVDVFDLSVFERSPTPADLSPGGAGYSLVWGRFHTPAAVDYFLRRVGCSLCIVGHTPQEEGFAVIGNMLILASDHNHGVFLPIDLSRQYNMEQLVSGIRKFVSVA